LSSSCGLLLNLTLPGASIKSRDKELVMRQIRAIKVDDDRCRDCQVCILVCSLYHHGESNPSMSRVFINKDMVNYKFNITICLHCSDPDCVLACPSDALEIDERGVVLFIQDECTQCGLCAETCPNNAIFYNTIQDLYFKCDLCVGSSYGPLCAKLCPVGALTIREGVD